MDPIILGFTALGAAVIAVCLNWQTHKEIKGISNKGDHTSVGNNYINQEVIKNFNFDSTRFFQTRLSNAVNSYTNAEKLNLKRALYAAIIDIETLNKKLEGTVTDEEANEIRKQIKISEERLEKIKSHSDLTDLAMKTVVDNTTVGKDLESNKAARLKALNANPEDESQESLAPKN